MHAHNCQKHALKLIISIQRSRLTITAISLGKKDPACMDILFTIVCAIFVIGVLVLIHEGGHYLAARAFKVRVTEFMVGLPAPNIGVKIGQTKFGLTALPLGGYAKVCGMETGNLSPHLEAVMGSILDRGTATMEEVADDCDITDEEAYEALEELVEWGTITGPTRRDKLNTYRTASYMPTSKDKKMAMRLGLPEPERLEAGTPREVSDLHDFYEREYVVQYRHLPFWKRSVILLAGIAVNLLFAVVAFIVVYSVIGVDVMNPQTNEVVHVNATPLQSIQIGFNFIGMTFQAIIGLFNPETAAQTVSESTSIVGIAIMSGNFFAAGLAEGLFFMAAISISLGLMNLLPIPPLDGGRFLVEIIQKITRRDVSMKVLGYVSAAGMALFLCFFVFMLNQDIQRFILGNW